MKNFEHVTRKANSTQEVKLGLATNVCKVTFNPEDSERYQQSSGRGTQWSMLPERLQEKGEIHFLEVGNFVNNLGAKTSLSRINTRQAHYKATKNSDMKKT